MDFKLFLDALPAAATSPYAYAAYVLALGAWIATMWLRGQPERKSEQILKGYKDDTSRNAALAKLLGQAPPDNLPKSQIMDWVRIQSAEKSKSYIFIVVLAVIVAFIVVVVVALTTSREAAQGPPSQFQVQFSGAGADGAECLSLTGQRVTVTSARSSGSAQKAVVEGCQATVSWTGDWRLGDQANVVIDDPAFERDKPEETYRLGDLKWVVTLKPKAKAPRLLVEVFDYSTGDSSGTELFPHFYNIVSQKIRVLADSLRTQPSCGCAYLGGLRVDRTRRTLGSSPDQVLSEWRSSHSLLLLSGIFFKQDSANFVRSQPFFGELTEGGVLNRVQLDLRVDASEFGRTADSHSLALLYALAMDAQRLGQPPHVILAFLGEAVSIAGGIDSAMPGVASLKDQLRKALVSLGAPVPAVL